MASSVGFVYVCGGLDGLAPKKHPNFAKFST
jgi:hypothetical protein